jgi:hypothetical protein
MNAERQDGEEAWMQESLNAGKVELKKGYDNLGKLLWHFYQAVKGR